jgi:hypothetical protein
MNAPIRKLLSVSNGAVDWLPGSLWGLWHMLQSYFPIYKITVEIQRLQRTAEVFKDSKRQVDEPDAKSFQLLLKEIHRECLALGLISAHEMASRLIDKARQKSTPLCLWTLII